MAGVCALLLLEGETEEEFYEAFLHKFARNARRAVKNLKGNFNINKKIIESSYRYSDKHPTQTFDVFVCIDQERIDVPAFDFKKVLAELEKIPAFRNLVPVITILTIESIFFLDINGIFSYLKAPKSRRKIKPFVNFRVHNHKTLASLFKQYGKVYCKGRRCAGLISSLNMDLMCKASELAKLKSDLATIDKAERKRSSAKRKTN